MLVEVIGVEAGARGYHLHSDMDRPIRTRARRTAIHLPRHRVSHLPVARRRRSATAGGARRRKAGTCRLMRTRRRAMATNRKAARRRLSRDTQCFPVHRTRIMGTSSTEERPRRMLRASMATAKPPRKCGEHQPCENRMRRGSMEARTQKAVPGRRLPGAGVLRLCVPMTMAVAARNWDGHSRLVTAPGVVTASVLCESLHHCAGRLWPTWECIVWELEHDQTNVIGARSAWVSPGRGWPVGLKPGLCQVPSRTHLS